MDDAERRIAEGALFTDQYQLSMAQVYFRRGIHRRRALFDYYFRRYPDYGTHQAGYCIAAGLEDLLGWMETTRFTATDLDLMRRHRTSTGTPMFDDDFLGWLEVDGHFGDLEIRAVPEGRVVHPNAPVAVVSGPLAMAQILETSLLNHLNYATLIATKASRVVESADGATVLEFGMRRGPGRGVVAGARAALVGGAASTSNVGISHVLGIPPKGTHAHSFVQVEMALHPHSPSDGELAAFRAFAETYPDDCVLLVDTIDTLHSGVPNAIAVFRDLVDAGHTPAGIRLDSGDLAHLAVRSAEMLDAAGLTQVPIVLSSNLDELAIWQIRTQIAGEAPRYGLDPGSVTGRLVYGVGTRLISSHGYSALDGVYKLVAVQDDAGAMVPAIKVSDTPEKTPIPGEKRLWRVYDRRGLATVDVVAAPEEQIGGSALRLHHPFKPEVGRTLDQAEIGGAEELLVPVWDGGRVDDPGTVEAARRRRQPDLDRLDPGVRRLVNPHVYHVSLTDEMARLREDLIERTKPGV